MHEGLERLLEAEVHGAGFKLYHWRVIPGGRRRILRVFVHGDEGVNLDDCARISRRLGPAIEAAEAIQGSYTLEISTPGMDRTLHEVWHYELALGLKARVLVTRPVARVTIGFFVYRGRGRRALPSQAWL